MERSRVISVITLLLSVFLAGCVSKPKQEGTTPVYQTQQFRDYWHAGKAEVNAYNLMQSRYGESRRGKAVLIFVTEDLSKKLQVKLDDPSRRNNINVLKLNFTKKFITGIYPYSLMLSVFTPVNRDKEPSSLKASMSSQEWCGHVYTQVNLRGNRYAIASHSYFEEEADERFSVRQALLEDELWNFIRLDPENLPVGEINVVPGLFYTRLSHVDLKVRSAIGEKTETDSAYLYHLTFPQQERKMSIRYAKGFPHQILGWTETWQEKGNTMETTATLDKSMYTDYWTKNKNEFQFLRDSLNLPSPY
jgi:hypothetical protein